MVRAAQLNVLQSVTLAFMSVASFRAADFHINLFQKAAELDATSALAISGLGALMSLTFAQASWTSVVNNIFDNYENLRKFITDLGNRPNSSNQFRQSSRPYQTAETHQRSNYHSPSSTHTNYGVPTSAKALFAAGIIGGMMAAGHMMYKPVIEAGCKAGVSNKTACDILGLEYNERQPTSWPSKKPTF